MSKLDEALEEKYPYDMAPVDICFSYGINDLAKEKPDRFKDGAKWLLREAGKLETQEGCQACRLIDAVQIEDLRKLVEG